MDIDDYVWYRDDNNILHSVGYPIKNLFKELDIPAITGTQHPLKCKMDQFNDLAIPIGLVYMHSAVLPSKDKEIEETTIGIQEPTSPDLYSKLMDLVQIKKRTPRTRKRKKKLKNKSRKNK